MTRLRRVEPGDVDVLESEYVGPEVAGEYNWFGFTDTGRVRRRVEAGETLTRDGGILAIVDDSDQVVGAVSWTTSHNGPPPVGTCWNLGIWVVPDHRGTGHGSEAQRLAAGYLFDVSRMERVQASTERDNIAEQRALEKAGFTREGVLRRSCFRGGAWRDMVLYSKLRGE